MMDAEMVGLAEWLIIVAVAAAALIVLRALAVALSPLVVGILIRLRVMK